MLWMFHFVAGVVKQFPPEDTDHLSLAGDGSLSLQRLKGPVQSGPAYADTGG